MDMTAYKNNCILDSSLFTTIQ